MEDIQDELSDCHPIPPVTPVSSAFEASDSVTNLKVIGDKYGEEIGKLEKHVWK